MIRSLNSGVSGLLNMQQQMDVIGNNIANVNTTGFKSARVNFADAFSDTLRASSSATGTSSGTPALQIGTGVMITNIRNVFTQGAVVRTNTPTDLAIAGEGFYIVRDPITELQFATRSGAFRVDTNGYLVTDTGLRVQGFSDGALATRGDVMINDVGRPPEISATAKMVGFAFDPKGQVKIKLDDGTEYTRGQVLLQKFSDPQALTKEGLSLFTNIGAAGPLGGSESPTAEQPGTNGLGKIEMGSLEISNVDLANEFSNMITTQRAFQANARIITTSDEMLQELVNLKR
jgi:flagellar hook protein FlgE